MEDNNQNLPLQRPNPLPSQLFNVGFFEKNKLEMVPEKQDTTLVTTNKEDVSEKQIPISPIFNPVVQPVQVVSQTPNPKNLKLESDNSQIIPEAKKEAQMSPLSTQQGIQSALIQESKEPLSLKSESLNKTNFNMAEINNQHKEIQSLEERIKLYPSQQKAEKRTPPTVVNNYSSSGSGGGSFAPNRSDPLSSIKNTMRSIPAWRTEMG